MEVVEEPPSLLLAQEMIVKLKRNMEKMMSRCFTWFPIGGYRRTQYITSIGLFYKNVVILLGGCLTVKNSGSYSQEMMGLFLGENLLGR